MGIKKKDAVLEANIHQDCKKGMRGHEPSPPAPGLSENITKFFQSYAADLNVVHDL